jgi:hypothetical protein
MLEEVYAKATMEKTPVYDWHKLLLSALPNSM